MIKLENISVTFPGGIEALKPVSLELRPGQFTVVLGGSGAGKSTLLRCCNLLQRPTTGQMLVDGNEVLGRSALLQHRRHTAMIFQLHHLIGRKSALENVLVGRLGYHGFVRSMLPLPEADVRLALRCLDRVGILHKADARVTQLSGGERQRVGVARALVQQPKIILADEPIASLDPVTSRNVLEILRTICKADGITAVVTLHQVEFAREFADRILGFTDGHLVFDGPASALDADAIRRIYPRGEEHVSPQSTTRFSAVLMPSCSGDAAQFVDE